MPVRQVSLGSLRSNGDNGKNQVNRLNFEYSERKIRMLIKLGMGSERQDEYVQRP